MGQPLPLPYRIPRPSNETLRKELEEAGVILDLTDPLQQYVTYSMPTGWQLINDSKREDMPDFYMVDDKGMVRFQIFGSWKETCDNKLTLRKVKFPCEFKARKKAEDLLPGETTMEAFVNKVDEAGWKAATKRTSTLLSDSPGENVPITPS